MTIKNNTIIIGAAILPLLAGCASQPVTLSPVGPAPGTTAGSGATGCLQVYSATEKSNVVGDYTSFNLHIGYDIRDESGQVVQFVANHTSDMDEWPDQVKLPAGNYSIEVQSARCGLVKVPVTVQKNRVTVVHLDDNNWRPAGGTTSNQLVYLPDGEAVGWSSGMVASPE